MGKEFAVVRTAANYCELRCPATAVRTAANWLGTSAVYATTKWNVTEFVVWRIH
jgi:hypothetical protein